MKKIILHSETILNKKFDTELSGYNATDVDLYLDAIIGDYRAYEEGVVEYEKLLADKNKLLADKDVLIQSLNMEITILKEQLEKTGKVTNFAILEELKNLQIKLDKAEKQNKTK